MRAALRFAALAVILGLAACNNNNKSGAGADTGQDMSLGDPKAPVTLIEYASVTCPHCAKWNAETFPAFKAKYVDTGKVHYVFRETLIHPEFDVIGYRLARCAGPKNYFHVIDAIMRSQDQIFTGDPRAAFLNIAKTTGMNEDQFNKCVNDEDAQKKLFDRAQKESSEFNVSGTPTFILNGKKVAESAEAASIDQLSGDIDPLLAKKPA